MRKSPGPSWSYRAIVVAPTVRELDALRCIANGLDDRMGAELLGISESTFRKHLVMVRYKLGAKNRAHAITLAMRAGLIT